MKSLLRNLCQCTYVEVRMINIFLEPENFKMTLIIFVRFGLSSRPFMLLQPTPCIQHHCRLRRNTTLNGTNDGAFKRFKRSSNMDVLIFCCKNKTKIINALKCEIMIPLRSITKKKKRKKGKKEENVARMVSWNIYEAGVHCENFCYNIWTRS